MPNRSTRPIAPSRVTSKKAAPVDESPAVAQVLERRVAREILELLWTEKSSSRAEIARRMDVSRSTVSEIVTALLETSLVSETGEGESIGGRRPIMLEFQDDSHVILGVDMGASHLGVAATNLRGQVLGWEERPHAVRGDPAGTRALLRTLVNTVLASQRRGRSRLLGVGIAVPSPVDLREPNRLSHTVLPAWGGRGIVDDVAALTGRPVLVDNDANLGALAERWWGASRHARDSAYLKIATGIGSGHIIDGRVYRGANGTAGEIGHLSIDEKGPPCVCGLRGCLTTYVGTEALEARARVLVAREPSSKLAAGPITMTAIEDAAIDGDEVAKQVIREAAEHLGTAVAGMLNLMNPAVVTLGGSLARVGELLLDPLRETVRGRTLVSSVTAADVVASELGAKSIAIGATTMVLAALLERPSAFLYPGLEGAALS